MHFHSFFDLLKFPHHVLVNVKTSRCIQDHKIVVIFHCMFQRCLRYICRPVVLSHGKYFHSLLFPVDLQLLNCCRTVYITGYKQRFLSFQLKLPCKLCCGRRLTGTLKSCHHDDCDRLSRLQGNLRRLGTHQLYKLLVYDLDHHLTRVQTVHHILPDRPLLYIIYKTFDHFKVYICLQERHLDFLQCCFDIVLCQSAFSS